MRSLSIALLLILANTSCAQTAEELHRRGEEHFRAGRIAESIADFDKELELAPNAAPHHWQRGIALYYAGEYEQGVAQFESHQKVNPQDVENAVWHFLCDVRAPGGSVKKAQQQLIPIDSDPRIPMAEVHQMFAGKLTLEEVLQAGEKGGDQGKFYADLYVGLYCEALGKHKESLAHIKRAAENPAGRNSYMGDAARVHAKLRAVPTPLPEAHAHNDYYHPAPLFDALSHGFCSIEADIYLFRGELLVGHGLHELKLERTLEALYLKPLAERVKLYGGAFPDGPPVTLLIDIKSDGPETYVALHKVLEKHAGMLTVVEDGKLREGAVTVVISGNRPVKEIAATKTRYAGIDGRVGDLESNAASHLIPLISDQWGSHFKWRGSGPMPDDERRKLAEIVQKAHEGGRRVRFWATPENPAVWAELQAAEVDLIGTDELATLRRHLRAPER
jgi:tetratricopeptide (TPR) repeat protein